VIKAEVKTLGEAREAVAARIDWVMLDNMSLQDMRVVVQERDRRAEGPRTRLEAIRERRSQDRASRRSDRRRRDLGRGADPLGAALDVTMLVT